MLAPDAKLSRDSHRGLSYESQRGAAAVSEVFSAVSLSCSQRSIACFLTMS
jgi:hypothetical protein